MTAEEERAGTEKPRFIAYSDYLCPWCYNASVRLGRLEQEMDGRVEIEWRSYLLRPRPAVGRTLEKFRSYTESWLRPAAEADSGEFRVWDSEEGPPSHSVPAHVVAKAASSLGQASFERMHDRLLRAYFSENRDISNRQVQRELWEELAFPAAAFERIDDPELLQQVLREHNEALEAGATGVPAVRVEGRPGIIVGAQPLALYVRWATRILAESGAAVSHS